jgi:hypothetical protein
VERAVTVANGVIVVCTPDEYSSLHIEHHGPQDRREHAHARWQPRPNVLYEAGMAFALRPAGTFFVTVGPDVRLFTDVDAFYPVRLMADSQEVREEIIGRLESAGVVVRRDRERSYLQAGNFRGVLEGLARKYPGEDKV